MNPRETLKERLGPGFWIDQEDNLHISVPELLQVADLPDTPENREHVQAIAQASLASITGGQATVIRRTGKCPHCGHNLLKVEAGKIHCLRCHGAFNADELIAGLSN